MNKITGLLINVTNEKIEIITIENTIEEIYRITNCDCIDIIVRRIGKQNKPYNIVCDDEGWLKSNPKISGISANEKLVGNLFITNEKNGDLTSLTIEDINYIKQSIKTIIINYQMYDALIYND